MGKRKYQAKNVKHIDVERLCEQLQAPCIVAVDIAKEEQAVAFAQPDGQIVTHARFSHPNQTLTFIELVEQLSRAGLKPEVVFEPTGTYGDALRANLHNRAIPVFRLSPKRTHDAAEVYDGVPSKHDVKDSAVMARLHAQAVSKPWRLETGTRRDLRAVVQRRELYVEQFERHRGRMEALLARHWPELEAHLEVGKQKTALELLAKYPGPAAVSASAEDAKELMRRVSRARLSSQTIEQVLEAARNSLGVAMREQECQLLRELVQEMLRLLEHKRRVEKELGELVEHNELVSRLEATVGKNTAALMVAMLGDPSEYGSAAAYEKAMGLNLKEHSSGRNSTRHPGLHITKRGPGSVRKYLFLAALRIIQADPICRAWYQRRQAYKQGKKLKAVVALMRKMARALWHVAQGNEFDARLLFETNRLFQVSRQKPKERRIRISPASHAMDRQAIAAPAGCERGGCEQRAKV